MLAKISTTVNLAFVFEVIHNSTFRTLPSINSKNSQKIIDLLLVPHHAYKYKAYQMKNYARYNEKDFQQYDHVSRILPSAPYHPLKVFDAQNNIRQKVHTAHWEFLDNV